ncbi:uncharacterized protein I303_103340 [Kwoniella dejecticola CBS 10117]|uniref:Uncharacterized protein n=1 Tax=Kwoniella dejecticola CBS 10117 TaxID=1296121 RepID=A0A1A6A6G2_9TREE|nr:uncharacterized protein I303_03363 [Kwoniella dejecticola CBS 10117]OBR85652.1 hypothetical protein I303_03363 [Kwoniella dejecticola CBS 10117]
MSSTTIPSSAFHELASPAHPRPRSRFISISLKPIHIFVQDGANLDVKTLILDHLSSASTSDLKTATRLSQDCYTRYAPTLYKRLHIKHYHCPIRFKLMLPKYRKGYHPFTEEDEMKYKIFRARRLAILKSCRYIKFADKRDVQFTILFLGEFYIKEKPLDNVSYLTLIGTHLDFDLGDKTIFNDKRKAANKFWTMMDPTHICINPNPALSREYQRKPTLFRREEQSEGEFERLFKYVLPGKKRQSISYHESGGGSIVLSEIPVQRYFAKEPEPGEYRSPWRGLDYSLNAVCLSQRPSRADDEVRETRPNFGTIEICNWPLTNSAVLKFDPHLHGWVPTQTEENGLSFSSPDETTPCVCCGKK